MIPIKFDLLINSKDGVLDAQEIRENFEGITDSEVPPVLTLDYGFL